ncbi:MAG: exonuclease domain-containing protein [Candidatus Dormibacteria bacterium]
MTGWAAGPLVAFDTETTGLDVETDRIVTAFVGDGSAGDLHWLVDPGVAMPAKATAIHGITTHEARARGLPAAEAIDEITDALARALAAGISVVTYNAVYDFTLLDRECRRHGLRLLEDRVGRPVGPLVDPLVLDRHLDPYRTGSRRLPDVCRAYGVRMLGAHDAQGDALTVLALARSMARRYSGAARLTAPTLHQLQVVAAHKRAAGFAAYLRRQGASDRDVEWSWPVRPFPGLSARPLVGLAS